MRKMLREGGNVNSVSQQQPGKLEAGGVLLAAEVQRQERLWRFLSLLAKQKMILYMNLRGREEVEEYEKKKR